MSGASTRITMRGSGPATVEVASAPRVALAVRLLFAGGFDTVEIAALLHRVEPDIYDLLHAHLPRSEDEA